MPKKNFRLICLVFCLLIGSLLGCSMSAPGISIQTTPSNTTSSQGQHDNTSVLNTWQQVASGVEVRYEHWKSPGPDEDTVTIARFELQKVHLSIGYQPDKPPLMSDWMKQTKALASINGGYFDKNNQPTGLLVSNGQAAGTSYAGFGGMLAVDMQGHVSLRSLHNQPYSDGEQFQQVTQSSPMLIINGKRTQFQADSSSQRRSVAALDTKGRLLLIASPGQSFTLDELADLLASSDLSIQTALNLDGGASTALYVNGKDPTQSVDIDSFSPLPIVIIVE